MANELLSKIKNKNNIIKAEFYNNTDLINNPSGTGPYAPIFTIDNVIKLIDEGRKKKEKKSN